MFKVAETIFVVSVKGDLLIFKHAHYFRHTIVSLDSPFNCTVISVPDPGKGVCVDPVNGGAILGKGGPERQGGNKERQLSPDKGREKT